MVASPTRDSQDMFQVILRESAALISDSDIHLSAMALNLCHISIRTQVIFSSIFFFACHEKRFPCFLLCKRTNKF